MHSAQATDAATIYCEAAAVEKCFLDPNKDAEAKLFGLSAQDYCIKIAMWDCGDKQNSNRDITQPPGSAHR
jgi:hypothetical protein